MSTVDLKVLALARQFACELIGDDSVRATPPTVVVNPHWRRDAENASRAAAQEDAAEAAAAEDVNEDVDDDNQNESNADEDKVEADQNNNNNDDDDDDDDDNNDKDVQKGNFSICCKF